MKNRIILALLLGCAVLLALSSACGEWPEATETYCPYGSGHQWGEWDPIRDATCTEPGQKIRYCTLCFYRQLGTIPALGHDWGSWSTLSEAGCEAEGERIHYCQRCGAQERETVPAKGHQWGKWVQDEPGTCVKEELLRRKCSVCGAYDWIFGEFGDHSWGEWQRLSEPTPFAPGLEERVCALCGASEEREIPYEGGFPSMHLEAVMDSPPASAYEPGQKVSYDLTLTNDGGVDLEWIRICVLNGDQDFIFIRTLSVGETVTVASDYTVSLYDAGKDAIDMWWMAEGYIIGTADDYMNNGKDVNTEPLIYSNEVTDQLPVKPAENSLNMKLYPMWKYDWQDEADWFEYDKDQNIVQVAVGWFTGHRMRVDVKDWIICYTVNGGPEQTISLGDVAYNMEMDIASVSSDLTFPNEPETYADGWLIVTAYATCVRADNGEEVTSGTVTVEIPQPQVELKPSLSFLRTVDANEGEGKRWEGAVIHFRDRLINDGNVELVIPWYAASEFIEDLSTAPNGWDTFDGVPAVILDPGQEWSFTFLHKVRSHEAAQGFVEYDCVYGSYWDNEGSLLTCSSNAQEGTVTLTAPAEEASPSLQLTMVPDLNGTTWDEGDEINLTYLIENTGNVQLEVREEYFSWYSDGDPYNMFTPITPIYLDPGETAPYAFSVIVSEKYSTPGTGYNEHDVYLTGFEPGGEAELCSSNTVSVRLNVREEPPVPPVTAGDIKVVKKVTSLPKELGGYQKGEKIIYSISVTNMGKTAIDGHLYDDHLGGWIEALPVLLPGETRTVEDLAYEVTDPDVDAGCVLNQAYVDWDDPASGTPQRAYSNLVRELTIDKDQRNAYLSVSKWVGNLPASGYFSVNDVIDFVIEVENCGDMPLYNVRVCDNQHWSGESGGLITTIPLLNPHAVETVHSYRTVTELDGLYVTDIAWASAQVMDALGYAWEVTAWSQPAVAPIGQKPDDVTVVKTETSHPLHDRYYEDEVIYYAITVFNNTDEVLYGIHVYDILEPTLPGEIAYRMQLDPHDSFTTPYFHKVSHQDCVDQWVVNQAIVEYANRRQEFFVKSNEVHSPTGFPVIPPVVPPVDPPKRAEGDCCRLTLETVGADQRVYRLSLCSEHAPCDAAPEPRQAWLDALDAEYQQVLTAGGAPARMAVMSDRLAFRQYLANEEILLRLLWPDQPERVEERIVSLIRSRCAELCYSLHCAPEDRPDSILTGPYDTEIGRLLRAGCGIGLTRLSGDAYEIQVTFCAGHAETEKALNSLAAGASGRRERAIAFRKAEVVWDNALDAQTAAFMAAARPEVRGFLPVWRNSVRAMMQERAAVYDLFYPGRPEVTAELTARDLEEAVVFLCGEAAR